MFYISCDQGLLQKAELLLEQGDYENALSYFQKGARMRPDKDDFHEGIERAKHGLSEHHKGMGHFVQDGRMSINKLEIHIASPTFL